MEFPRILVGYGDRFRTIMPFSEVCLHMKIAGKEMIVQVLNSISAQVYTLEGEEFSAPITTGEAGVYTDLAGSLYAYGEKLEG